MRSNENIHVVKSFKGGNDKKGKESKEGEGPHNIYLVDSYQLTAMGQSLF